MRTKKKEALEQRDKLQKERVVERSERQKLEMQLKISEGKVRERDRDIEHLEGEIKVGNKARIYWQIKVCPSLFDSLLCLI